MTERFPGDIPLPQEWLDKMRGTPQNPRYHAEGDVLVHTREVLQQFLDKHTQFSLSEDEQLALYWAAVLHDIGKTQVTVWQDGRWRSQGHEKAGVPIARAFMQSREDISPVVRTLALDLVRWHGVPLKWLDYQGPDSDMKLLGTRTDLRLLSIFTLFDLYGRKSEDQDRVEKMADQFVYHVVPKIEFELGSFRSLQQSFSSWNLKHKNAAWNAVKMGQPAFIEKLLTAEPYEEERRQLPRKVILALGPEGCGKTMHFEKNYPHGFRVNLADHTVTDAIAADAFQRERRLTEFRYHLEIYLRQHPLVLLEGSLTNESMRRRIADSVRDLGAHLRYELFEPHSRLHLLPDASAHAEAAGDAAYRYFSSGDMIHPWEAHEIEVIIPGE